MAEIHLQALGGLVGLPKLPAVVTCKDRQILSTKGLVWSLRMNVDGGGLVDIDFRPMSRFATSRFVEIAKLYLARKARTSAAVSLRNIAHTLNRSVKYWYGLRGSAVDWSEIDVPSFQSLLAYGMQSTGVAGNDFAIVRAIYNWGCHVARLRDFDVATALQIKEIKASGNRKGQKVLSADPRDGDFSPEEIELLDMAIKDGRGDLRELVITQLFHELGIRPIQILRTRWSGLRKYETKIVELGVSRTLIRYTLNIPRAKERGEHRVEEARPISTLLGSRFDSLKPTPLVETTPLCWWLATDASSDDVAHVVQHWVDEIGIISPRTQEPLKANPSRFRYSLATDAARDGASKFDIAHLLFHADLQNVEVYFDAAGTVMEQIEGRLDRTFGPHINQFLGRIASDSDPSPHAGMERRVVPGVFPQLPDAPVLQLGLGACGQNVQRDGVCKLAPPLTCYRCPKFAAFREADHKAVADALESMARTRFDGSADDRIGGELVLTIQAIRDLEQQIAVEGVDE